MRISDWSSDVCSSDLENISYVEVEKRIGADLAKQVRDATLTIYAQASEYARARGIIIADTKFEFGVDDHGTLHLIDEALTPDSSRFWPAIGRASCRERVCPNV